MSILTIIIVYVLVTCAATVSNMVLSMREFYICVYIYTSFNIGIIVSAYSPPLMYIVYYMSKERIKTIQGYGVASVPQGSTGKWLRTGGKAMKEGGRGGGSDDDH